MTFPPYNKNYTAEKQRRIKMKRPNVIYAVPLYDENGNLIEGSVQKQLDYGKKFINTHIGKVNGTAIEKESEILKPITDRYVFNEIGMHYFLDDRINVVMDIELIRNIDSEVIESLVAKSDLYEIILLDKGKYVSHFGLSKPFVIKVFSYNGNEEHHEVDESFRTYSNAAVYVLGGHEDMLAENGFSQLCASEMYVSKVLDINKLTAFIEDGDHIKDSLKTRVQYDIMLSKIKAGEFDLVVITKETIPETEFDNAVNELRQYAAVVVMDNSYGFEFLEKVE